jgi:cytoskeletal protein RodZ
MGDAELVEDGGTTMSVGERLREAREAAGLTLEDIATSTRIPTRHLESLEASDFARLPAPTYTIGFAKNYAGAVGLDRAEIGDQLRTEMGGSRPATSIPSEVFEPADPARAMPKWLIVGTIGALLLAALLFNWLSNRSLEGPDEAAATNAVAAAPAPAQAPPQGQGPVVITATDKAWVDIKDGNIVLKQGELAAGEAFQLPANAVAPTLTTAKAEALRITVGTTVAAPVGPATTKVTVSLKPEDLLRSRPASAAVVPAPAPPPQQVAPARPAPARRAAPPRQDPPAAPPPTQPQPSANEAATTPQQ